MSAIAVGRDLIHYEVLGRGGRPVVLVHGWLGSWRYWVPLMQQLHMRYRVYALDLFGYGDSEKNPARYSVERQAEMLEVFMTELHIPKAAFIGHGLGAMVVAEFAFQHQKTRVPRAMLISTPLFDTGDLQQRQPVRVSRPKRNDDFFANDPDRTIPSSRSLEATIPSAGMMRAALMERAAARNKEMGKIESPIATNRGGDVRNNLLAESLNTNSLTTMLERCFRRTEVEFDKLQPDVGKTDRRILDITVGNYDAGKMLDTVQQLQLPTVLVHGEDDPLLPVPTEDVWEYVTQDNDTTLAISLPGIRHFPMLENERFGRLVNDFLQTPDISNLELRERWRRRSR